MDREVAELVIDWYLDTEARLAETLKVIPLTERTEAVVLPCLAGTVVEAGSLINSVFRSHYTGPEAPERAGMKAYHAQFEAGLLLSSTRTLLFRRPPNYVRPFSPWATDYQELTWWTAYNNLKHDRAVSYSESTLRNAIDCVCALHQVIAKLDTFFWPLVDRNLIMLGTLAPSYVLEDIYSTAPNHTVLVETDLFATPVGRESFPDDPDKIRPVHFEFGRRLWRFLGLQN